jgi:hypothetical protein
MNDIEALRRLQEVDLKLSATEAKLAALEVEEREPRAAIEKMQTLGKKAHEDLTKIQREIHAKDGDLQDLQIRLKKAKEKLQKAISSKGVEAVQHEIALLEEKIAAAEEVELEVMEREEAVQAMCARIQTGVVQLEQKIRALEESRPARRAELETIQAEQAKDQEKWRGYLPEEILTRYDQARKRKKGKRAVVEIDNACPACDFSFTSSERMGYMNHADRVHDCPECKTLMIFVGAISLD